MRFKKLNNNGFEHITLIVAFVAVFAIAGVAYLVSSSAAGQCNKRTFSVGSKGPCVEVIQDTVKASPYDGKFGSKTAAKVKVFQRNRGLPADGVVGPSTWRKICSKLKTQTVANDRYLWACKNG
jgi:peptidoglycan hydrolase-like protein with peptidoglycan-binding domain